MRIDRTLLDEIDLPSSAHDVVTSPLDHFPRLLVDRCLENAADVLAKHTESSYLSGSSINAELLTVPRRGYGPRPVTISDAMSRTLYYAIVRALETYLPPASRLRGNYDKHRSFGFDDPTAAYVVELDIAACYEYIDHKRLAEELLVRSTSLDLCQAMAIYLSEIFGYSRGLPQMQTPSDRLADAYLSILERNLGRDGWSLSRYADDFRILATNWEQANHVVERGAEYARELGLILSSEKTKILRMQTVVNRHKEDQEFLASRIQIAKEDLSQVIFMAMGPYGEGEPITEEPTTLSAAQNACWQIVNEWGERAAESDPEVPLDSPEQRAIPAALIILGNYADRIPDKLITDMVFNTPLRLEQVCKYLTVRASSNTFTFEDHWRTLESLARMGRQSPWAKLWLMHTIETFLPTLGGPPGPVRKWTSQQLADRHEIVRAQAAWLLALVGDFGAEVVTDLYRRATRMSQPALAAAASRSGKTSPKVMSAIEQDHPLNREAVMWAST